MATNSSDFRLYEIADGAGGYPAEWHKTLKHLVRELAGHRCVRCKHPYQNGQHGRGEWTPCDEGCRHDGPLRLFGGGKEIDRIPAMSGGFVAADLFRAHKGLCAVEAQWRILTVHHIDGNKLNCRWWNLAALCQRCHLTIQGRVKLNRPWLLDHSEWFRPYVAGYYAATLLGEELDRDETMSRLDELLEVGRTGKAVEIGGVK
jgi:hypothetical protein